VFYQRIPICPYPDSIWLIIITEQNHFIDKNVRLSYMYISVFNYMSKPCCFTLGNTCYLDAANCNGDVTVAHEGACDEDMTVS